MGLVLLIPATASAAREQARALELYPAGDLTDRTLIRLDQALCLVADRDPAAGAVHATTALIDLPPEHRSALIIYRAQQVAAGVPRQAQQVREVRVRREVLALPAGERD